MKRIVEGMCLATLVIGELALAPEVGAVGEAGVQDASTSTIGVSRDDATAPPLYTADPDHSSLAFTVRHLKLTKVRGVFHRWNAAVSYDADDLLRSSVTVVVDAGSLDTDNEDRDRDLRSQHFFDVERFPWAVFQSTSLRRTSDGFVAEGEMEIRGIVRHVAIPFVHTGSFESPTGRSEREGFEGSLTVKRADYGVVHEGNILETSGAIGKTVTLEIELSAVRLNWGVFPFQRTEDGPSLGETLLGIVDSKGADAAVSRFRETLNEDAGSVETSHREMAILAGRLAEEGRVDVAATLLTIYAHTLPTQGNAQLLAAEALSNAGQRKRALEYYRRALALSPGSAEAAERIRRLNGRSHEATLLKLP